MVQKWRSKGISAARDLGDTRDAHHLVSVAAELVHLVMYDVCVTSVFEADKGSKLL